MRVVSVVPFVLTSAHIVAALPRAYESPDRRSDINILNDVLVFDAPAFEDPANPGQTLVQLQAYVSTQKISAGPLLSTIESFFKDTVGLDVGDTVSDIADRIELVSTIGVSGKDVKFDVDGCSESAQLQPTGDGGMATQNISLGTCGTETALGSVEMGPLRSAVEFDIFPSGPDGFGVISDIDDTIKISNTLDKIALIKATLLDDPTPVAGMPELYASLAKSLNDPAFFYITGSPFQLYPFLRGFIQDSYPASRGPIFPKNLTFSDLPDFLASDGQSTFNFKSEIIDRIHGIYPGKTFLTIGDSTEKDPEIYGAAIRKYGDFIACAWIRQVEGANNTAERFAAAFEGVDPSKFKIYTDEEIPSLADLDVAGGTCN
ncbi:DUF2183 domain-containing protein [Mycena kentingensis (nom. inval.)]|nr:DUF2183 domain-containing protein [Mycena kentingensis (nom. inval.)]